MSQVQEPSDGVGDFDDDEGCEGLEGRLGGCGLLEVGMGGFWPKDRCRESLYDVLGSGARCRGSL